jgi:hypothetical protein
MAVQVVGLDRVLLSLGALSAKLPGAVADPLYRDMVVVMAESQKIVPYDEGDLHDSGETDRPEIDGGKVEVTLHYGGGSVDYALVQHERLDYRHPNGGQAKFLDQPLSAWTQGGPESVVRRALREVRT